MRSCRSASPLATIALLTCACSRPSFNAVGTQSAVLAGFAMTSFAEIDLPHNAFYAQKVRAPGPRHRRAPDPMHEPATPTRRRVYTYLSPYRSARISCARPRPPSSRSGEAARLFGARCVHSAHGGLRTRPLSCLPILPPYPPFPPTSRPLPQDGSMFEAVDGMNDERAFIFTCFGAPLHGRPTCMANPHARGNRTQPDGPGLTRTLT